MYADSIPASLFTPDTLGLETPDPLRRLRDLPRRPAPSAARRPASSAARVAAPIAAATDPAALRLDVENIPASQILLQAGDMRVFYAHASQIPALLPEIGRLRELTFRAVGEGTGRDRDLDRYDSTYLHLILWDAAAATVAGAYRLGLVDQILADQGPRGLYTHELYSLPQDLIASLDAAIEMGRSFITAPYQRRYSSLLLLWQGIGAFLARSPCYHTLYGAASITNDYSPAAQQLMVAHLSRHFAHPTLHAQPRHRVTTPAWRWRLAPALAAIPGDIPALESTVAELDGGIGIPVLIRQYLKLGGRFLAFNRDPAFADSVDGLILVDLRQAPDRMRRRFLGTPAEAAPSP